jgi:hypothetical protein
LNRSRENFNPTLGGMAKSLAKADNKGIWAAWRHDELHKTLQQLFHDDQVDGMQFDFFRGLVDGYL